MKRLEPDAKPLIELPMTRAAAVLVLAASLGLSACSLMPGPGDPETVREARSQTTSSESKGFPSLGSVPRQAPRTSSVAERRQVAQGLSADRDDARDTDRVPRAGGKLDPAASARSRLPKLGPRLEAGTSTAAVPSPPPAVSRARTVPRPVLEPGKGSPRTHAADRVAMTDAPPAAPTTGTAVAPRVMTLASVGPEQRTLVQAFARALAQSASAPATVPPDTSFDAPAAAALTPAQTPVPGIVRETYNRPLVAESGVAPAASTPGSSIATPAPDASATVYFANGSARLNSEAKAIVRDIAETWKVRGGAVRVVGHASRRTGGMATSRHKLVNFRISLDRATVVANELIRLGVDGSAIQIAAIGESRPALDESMPEGEARNRRAEIFHSF